MYSHWSQCGQRQPPGDRRSRQWDEQEDRRLSHGHGRRSREYSGEDSSRRRASSPVSGKAGRRAAGDDGSECRYRYRSEPRDRTYQRPPLAADFFSRAHEELMEAPPQENGFRYEAGRGYRQEDAAYRRPYRGRSRDRSQERSRSRERATKSYGERAGSPSPADRHLHAAERSLNGASRQIHAPRQSCEGDVAPQAEQKQAKGFQRFLDILNRGVNMDTLSKIVAPGGAGQQAARAADRPPSPSRRRRRRSSREDERKERGERRGPASPSPPPPRRRSDGEPRRTASLTPEDERKRRQMQDVLQAIGLDLGLEELGQMSHRIQERLYGRRGGSAAAAAGPAGSPKRRSRSPSSSGSSCTPVPDERYGGRDSYSAERDDPNPAGRRSAEHEDADERDPEYRETAAASQLSPPVALFAPAARAMPPYCPAPVSPLPYPPPVFPHTPPAPFLPRHPPPAIHFPLVPPPPPNAFPFPPPAVNPQPQALKAEPRRRCLKVIETKPG